MISPRAAISTVFFSIGCSVAMISVMLPLIRLKYAFNEATFGQILLAFGCGALVALPLAHRLLQRYRHGLVTQITVAAALVALIVPASVSDIAALVISIFFAGVALATADIAMNANAVAVEQHYLDAGRRPMLSSCHGFYSLGGLAGLLFGPASQWLGLQWMALAGAGVLLLISGFASRHLLASVDDMPSDALGRPGALNPTLLLICFAALIAFTAEGAVVDWSGVYLDTVHGADPAWFGAAFAAFSLAMAAMRFVGDGLRNRFGNRQVVAVSLVFAAAAYLIISQADSGFATVLAYALLGLGLANVAPVCFLMAARVPGVRPSSGLALVVGIGYIGMLTFPPAIGWVADAWSLRTAFMGLACFLVLALAVTLVIPKQRKPSSSPKEAAVPEPGNR